MKNYWLLAGTALLVLGCAAVAPSPVVQPERAAPPPPARTAQKAAARSSEATDSIKTTKSPTPNEELAVLVVHSGALITQVNGDSTLQCMRPDCRIPLPPGTHRVAVKYLATATRSGSTVTYASMYPRIVEISLEPGHRYSVTVSGRLSHKWWISIEDQTANKTVYDDRDKPQ
jgi:hypothetical protein